MNNKGWMSKLSGYDAAVAFIFIAVSLVPILGKYIYPGLTFLQGSVIENRFLLGVLICVGGLFLFYNSFLVSRYRPKKMNKIIAGFFMLILGILPLILEYNALNYFGFPLQYSVPLEILQGLMVFFGIYLLIDAFMLRPGY
ncbi:hypothetical protein J4468_01150 [Candidatus Woesearchaeota archaeon]|nr:hypothetical protein [Candidatus Woesearchaeota archaeon]